MNATLLRVKFFKNETCIDRLLYIMITFEKWV